ncbi:MAG: glycosyltransferase family 2 protein [Acidimicrobiia bacterium]
MRVLLVGVGWSIGWWLCWRVSRVRLLNDFVPAPAISVVIPARDEERMLPVILDRLAEQTMPAAEVIVVDDESHDATAAVARARGAQVIAGQPLPPGWVGKPWALAQGVRAAHEEVVVLLDADVAPSPQFLARMGVLFPRVGGLVSVQPYHRVRRWWEHASAFFNLVAVMGTGIASPLRTRWRPVLAFGPVMMCRRDAFLTHVEHPEVLGAVLDDVALARRFAAAGDPITLHGGVGVVDFRMYDRPRDLVEGWTKNVAAGARATPVLRAMLFGVWITAGLGIWVGDDGSWFVLVAYVAFVVQIFVMLRQIGSFGPLTALAYPLLALAFVLLFGASIVLTVLGRVRWKGRTIRLRGS